MAAWCGVTSGSLWSRSSAADRRACLPAPPVSDSVALAGPQRRLYLRAGVGRREDPGCTPASRGGRHGICAVAGLRRAAPLTRDPVQLPPRPHAPQQRPALPAGPTERGGDHRRDARLRPPPEGVRLRAIIVVLWCAGLRISEALALTESDLEPRRGAVLIGARSAWTTGAGSNSSRGLSSAPACPSARCSASSATPRAGDPAGRPGSAPSSTKARFT